MHKKIWFSGTAPELFITHAVLSVHMGIALTSDELDTINREVNAALVRVSQLSYEVGLRRDSLVDCPDPSCYTWNSPSQFAQSYGPNCTVAACTDRIGNENGHLGFQCTVPLNGLTHSVQHQFLCDCLPGYWRGDRRSTLHLPLNISLTEMRSQSFICATRSLDDFWRDTVQAVDGMYGLKVDFLRAWRREQVIHAGSGITRMFPGVVQVRTGEKWDQCAEFPDPRGQPWFVQTVSGPKNIVVALETTTSNERLSAWLAAVDAFIQGLSHLDTFGVIVFGKTAQTVKLSGTTGMTIMSSSNKQLASSALSAIKPFKQGFSAFYGPAFKQAFALMNSVDANPRPCNNIIMFITTSPPNDPRDEGERQAWLDACGVYPTGCFVTDEGRVVSSPVLGTYRFGVDDPAWNKIIDSGQASLNARAHILTYADFANEELREVTQWLSCAHAGVARMVGGSPLNDGAMQSIPSNLFIGDISFLPYKSSRLTILPRINVEDEVILRVSMPVSGIMSDVEQTIAVVSVDVSLSQLLYHQKNVSSDESVPSSSTHLRRLDEQEILSVQRHLDFELGNSQCGYPWSECVLQQQRSLAGAVRCHHSQCSRASSYGSSCFQSNARVPSINDLLCTPLHLEVAQPVTANTSSISSHPQAVCCGSPPGQSVDFPCTNSTDFGSETSETELLPTSLSGNTDDSGSETSSKSNKTDRNVSWEFPVETEDKGILVEKKDDLSSIEWLQPRWGLNQTWYLAVIGTLAALGIIFLTTIAACICVKCGCCCVSPRKQTTSTETAVQQIVMSPAHPPENEQSSQNSTVDNAGSSNPHPNFNLGDINPSALHPVSASETQSQGQQQQRPNSLRNRTMYPTPTPTDVQLYITSLRPHGIQLQRAAESAENSDVATKGHVNDKKLIIPEKDMRNTHYFPDQKAPNVDEIPVPPRSESGPSYTPEDLQGHGGNVFHVVENQPVENNDGAPRRANGTRGQPWRLHFDDM